MRFPDYPFNSNYAEINGHKLHYLDEGPADAEPVVMLHGNPSWSFYYRKLVLALRDRYRCIVPDHIGMGLSEKPGAADYDFMFTRRADDLSSLLECLNIRQDITLVLHDWGGMIGMSYAFPFPERIKRLVILNTAAFHLPPEKKLPWSLKFSRIPLLNAILNQGFNAFCKGAVKYCVTRRPMPTEVAAAYLAPYDNWTNRLAVRRFVEDIPLKPGDVGYRTISRVASGLHRFQSLPMLIIWGMQDFVFDEPFLNEWMIRFPNAELHRLEDAGHYVLEDAPEDVIPLINNFLTQN
ncbi:MAG: alpha/beta fold hydrolase [Gammaproteobacteria bacterium]